MVAAPAELPERLPNGGRPHPWRRATREPPNKLASADTQTDRGEQGSIGTGQLAAARQGERYVVGDGEDNLGHARRDLAEQAVGGGASGSL